MAKAKVKQSDVERLLQPDVVKELAAAVPGFDRKAFLAAFIDCFGGVESFARNVYGEYQAAPAGTIQKQRWGALICNLLSQESQAEQVRPVETMSTDEIHASLKMLIDQVSPGVKPGG